MPAFRSRKANQSPRKPLVRSRRPDKTYLVRHETDLLSFVKEKLPGQSERNVRRIIANHQVAPIDHPDLIQAVIKKADPYHLVTLNGCRGARNLLQFLRASDLVSIDYYPSGKWPAHTVVPITEEMNRFPGYKPLRWWIQAYEIFNPEPPTKDEIIAMTYMVWAHGTSSVLYFIGIPDGELAEAQEICGRENLLLADAITAPYREELKVNGNTTSPGVYASLRKKNGKIWIITINQSDIAQKVSIELSGIPGQVKSLFDSRAVNVTHGRIEASYLPWERKVFEVVY